MFVAQATSVSLPEWKDNIDYEEGKARVVDKMTTGYPRFVDLLQRIVFATLTRLVIKVLHPQTHCLLC